MRGDPTSPQTPTPAPPNATDDASKLRGGFSNFAPPGEANNGIGWGAANYHPGKVAGDLTDAGDVAIMLLDHLAELKGRGALASYSFDTYAAHWESRIAGGYGSCNFMSVGREHRGACPPGLQPGYINGATRRTLQALGGAPPGSVTGAARKALAANVNCLMPATHFLPLFLTLPLEDEARVVAAAVDTVYLSHNNEDPLAAAAFLARALLARVRDGAPLRAALRAAAAASAHPRIPHWLAQAEAKAAEAADPASSLHAEGPGADDKAITSLGRLWDIGKSEPIKVGKASPTEGALPSALYFALRYENDFERALIANAECGGDSGARGIVIGMLLGSGAEWVRGGWLRRLPLISLSSSPPPPPTPMRAPPNATCSRRCPTPTGGSRASMRCRTCARRCRCWRAAWRAAAAVAASCEAERLVGRL